MRVPSFLIAVLWVANATASEAPPTCDTLEEEFNALPVSAPEFSAAMASGASAELCRVDPSMGATPLTCEGVVVGRFRTDRVSFAESTVWEGLLGANVAIQRLELGPNGWAASGIVWRGWEITSARGGAASECRLFGVRGHGMTLESLAPAGPVDVAVDGLPTFVETWGTVSAGFLPPSVRYAEAFEAETSGIVWRRLGLTAFGGDQTLGGGILWVTDRAAVASLAAVHHANTWSPAISGEVDSPRASAHLELAPETFAALRSIEWNTWARNYRVSQAGASLRGDEHALSVFAQTTDWERLDTQEVGLAFGSDAQVGGIRIDTDVRHASRWIADPVDEQSVHGSLVGVRVTHPLGMPALRVQPTLDAFMTYGLLPNDEGLDASTTASVQPSVSAQAIARGNFVGWAHRIGVRARAAAEIYGFTQRSPQRPRSLPYLWGRDSGAVLAQAEWVNGFEGRDWAIDLPVGATFLEASNEWRATARAEVMWGPLRGTARVAYGSAGDDVAWDANAEASWASLQLAAGVADATLDDLWPGDRALWAREWRGQPSTDERVWMTHLAWQPWAVIRTQARVFSAESRQGGLLWLGFAPRLGFEIGAGAGFEARSQDVTATAGLKLNGY